MNATNYSERVIILGNIHFSYAKSNRSDIIFHLSLCFVRIWCLTKVICLKETHMAFNCTACWSYFVWLLNRQMRIKKCRNWKQFLIVLLWCILDLKKIFNPRLISLHFQSNGPEIRNNKITPNLWMRIKFHSLTFSLCIVLIYKVHEFSVWPLLSICSNWQKAKL